MIRTLPATFKIALFFFLLGESFIGHSQCIPALNATATPTVQTICSGTPITTIVLGSNLPGTTFNWTRDNTATVTGIPASGLGNISGTLTNTTNAPVPVTFTITPQTTQLINEPFNTILPAGWAQQNNSSPLGSGPQSVWFPGTAYPPYSPPNFIAANYNSSTPGGSISNWLLTPEITFKNGDQFSFYTRTSGSAIIPDRLQVRMSVSGPSVNIGTSPVSVGDFTYLLMDINPTYASNGYPDIWTQFSATFAGLPGGVSGRIAFRYFTMTGNLPGENSTMIGIDDVSYTTSTACVGTPITATVVVNPNASVNLISNQTICNGTSTAPVNFSSPTSGGTIAYNWTNDNTAIGLGSSGTGSIPSFTATNPGNTAIAGTVTVTPTFTGTNSPWFPNPTPITIPSTGPTTGFLYPSIINVNGLPGTARLIRVLIHNFTHAAPAELDILVRSPSGQNVILMSDAGGSSSVSGLNMIFVDGGISMPATGPITSGTYGCTNYGTPDQWPAPGPGVLVQPNPSLSLFTGNPNGNWSLFVFDQANGNGGSINNGWTLVFDQGGTSTCTGTPTTFTYTINPSPTVSISSNIQPPLQPGDVLTLTANTSPPGGTYAWYKDGVLIVGATSNTLTGITVNDLGMYTVTYTDLNACVNTAGFNVYAKASTGLFIHPNPNNGHFRITFYNVSDEEVIITVFNSLGGVIVQQKTRTGTLSYAKAEIEMPPGYIIGTYMVEVRNSKGQRIGTNLVNIGR